MTLQEKVAQAHAIIDRAIAEHSPAKIIALFSGGYDSLVATHVTGLHPAFSGVAHIDTGIAVTEGGVSLPQQYVREVCERFGWPLSVYRTPIDYDAEVVANGFPGPALHYIMYRRLKDRGIYMLLKDHKTHRLQRIGLACGARRQESQRRMGTVEDVRRHRSQVWINVIPDWSEQETRDYIALHDLPRSPVKDALGMSGECLCGAFAKKGELDRICLHYPETGARIKALQERTHAAGHHWDWEGAPPRASRTARQEIEGATTFQPLCTSCNFRAGQVTPIGEQA